LDYWVRVKTLRITCLLNSGKKCIKLQEKPESIFYYGQYISQERLRNGIIFDNFGTWTRKKALHCALEGNRTSACTRKRDKGIGITSLKVCTAKYQTIKNFFVGQKSLDCSKGSFVRVFEEDFL
jgi:hypothetical protein